MTKIEQELRELRRMVKRLSDDQPPQEIVWLTKRQAGELLHINPGNLVSLRDSLQIDYTFNGRLFLFSRQSCLEYLKRKAKFFPTDETTNQPVPIRRQMVQR